MRNSSLPCSLALLALVALTSPHRAHASPVKAPAAACPTTDLEATIEQIAPEANGLRREVLRRGLEAFERARCAGRVQRNRLSIIDYSRPSKERRLWVIDVSDKRVLFHERVAHGRGSGLDLAEQFSNEANSNASSLGAFVTGETYLGKHGRSLRLDGQDAGLNDHARQRAIVVHAADYVTETFVQLHGRTGRSWGCPALDPSVTGRIIDAIEGGSVVWADGPSAVREPVTIVAQPRI